MICEKCGKDQIRIGDYKCKSCRNIYHTKWREENRDRWNSKSRAWVSENKEKRLLIIKKYEEKSREKRLAYKRRYYQENKEKYQQWQDLCDPIKKLEAKHRYRANKLKNGFVKYKRSDIFERDNSTCVYCGDKSEHLDHIIPISRGGIDAPENVAASCAFCNHSKGAKTAAEFMRPMFNKILSLTEELN